MQKTNDWATRITLINRVNSGTPGGVRHSNSYSTTNTGREIQ